MGSSGSRSTCADGTPPRQGHQGPPMAARPRAPASRTRRPSTFSAEPGPRGPKQTKTGAGRGWDGGSTFSGSQRLGGDGSGSSANPEKSAAGHLSLSLTRLRSRPTYLRPRSPLLKRRTEARSRVTPRREGVSSGGGACWGTCGGAPTRKQTRRPKPLPPHSWRVAPEVSDPPPAATSPHPLFTRGWWECLPLPGGFR